VALIGDSLTDFRSGGGGYVRLLEQRCPESTFSNLAKGGAMVNQMRARQLPSVAAQPVSRFTHLVVFGGVNDLYSDETAGRTPAKIETDLAAIYAAGKGRGLRVVALTVAPWGRYTRYFNERRSAATRELNAWILEQPSAQTVDVTVDAFALLSCGEPERLCPRFEPPFRDGLHFGALGQEALGQALYEAEFSTCS
jgi:lysophospholipase L1-like esterase